jgi:hypothetical protein
MRRCIGTVVGLFLIAAVLLIDPAFLWRAKYNFDEADMRAAVEGTWRVKVRDDTITLGITQGGAADRYSSRGWIPTAAACGQRTLIRSASACVDETRMPLHVTVLASKTGQWHTARGELSITSMSFTRAGLELEVAGMHVEAEITRDGAVADIDAVDGGHPATVALVRVSPAS